MISRYDYSKKIDNEKGKKVLSSYRLPEIPEKENDVYIITSIGDRLDSLAFKFYGNARYWWVLAVANNLAKGTLVIEPGTQLRIPVNPSDVITIVQTSNE